MHSYSKSDVLPFNKKLPVAFQRIYRARFVVIIYVNNMALLLPNVPTISSNITQQFMSTLDKGIHICEILKNTHEPFEFSYLQNTQPTLSTRISVF